MQEELIQFETAKLAKEKGFDSLKGVDSACYLLNGQKFPSTFSLQNYDGIVGREYTKFIHAPTQSLLQRWLREKHNIHIEVNSITTTINGYYIILRGIGFELNLDNDKQGNFYPIQEGLGYKVFNTYEQALEAGLLEVLKLVKV